MTRPSLLLAVTLLACAPSEDGKPAEPAFTADRISPEALDAMVAAPVAKVAAGRLEEGIRAFEAQLAGASAADKADLLTAFGVAVYKMGLSSGDDRLRRAALPFLERAIAVTAARFGAEHPETALALNTYADALRALSPDDPPREVDALYQRAYDIRVRTLGPGNLETLAVLLRIAQLKGHPTRTGGDSAKAEAAAALFEQVIKGRELNPEQPDYETAEDARFELIRMYVLNGAVAKAAAIARAADDKVPADRRGCGTLPHRAAFRSALEEAGREAEARADAAAEPPQPASCRDLGEFELMR